MQAIFQTVAIVGPGLVGGSLGLALRKRGLAGRVIGVGRRDSSLQAALRAGAVHEATLDLARGVAGADLVVLATPVSAFQGLMPAVAQAMKPGALLTDVASTKQAVIATVERALADAGRRDVVFVPTHPMAGSEKHGAQNAQEHLFEGSACIFTPLEGTPRAALHALRATWEAVGAKVHVMDGMAHDHLVARISHLPHVAAVALMDVVAEPEGAFAGGGLIDTTRVASGDPKVWRDICESNAGQITQALDEYLRALRDVRALLVEGRFDELEALLGRIKQKRDGLLALRRDAGPSREA